MQALLWRWQEIANRDHEAATQEYEALLAEYEAASKSKPKAGEPKPIKPTPPVLRHHYFNDTTMEAMVGVLANSPRGRHRESGDRRYLPGLACDHGNTASIPRRHRRF